MIETQNNCAAFGVMLYSGAYRTKFRANEIKCNSFQTNSLAAMKAFKKLISLA